MRSALLLLSSLILVCAAPAAAQSPLLTGLGGPEGFGEDCLHPNDDGSSRAIDLRAAFPSGLRFFSETHTQVYVNTNGNITFSAPLSDYTPDPFPVADQPMIAPYWADIDIRPEDDCTTGTTGVCEDPSSNGVWWALEPGRMIVTWDDVGYFSCHEDKLMRFQLILTAVETCGGGATDFDVEFRFNTCEWETGDIGGVGGFGGVEAQCGFDAGNSRDFVEIPGSREAGVAEHMCTESNVGEPGVWRFQIRSGAVLCPDAGAACDTGMAGACGEGVMQCVGTGTACQPVVPASAETCDAVDNDCDAEVDEGDSICASATEVCDRGRCIETCFEGGCPAGQECTSAGQCMDVGCEGLDCAPGERCVAGVCGDACAGVTCPVGLSCRAGRCLDLCAGIACDPSCTACSEGECVPRCDLPGGGCDAGETCTDDGVCEATACLGVECPAEGEVCVPGRGCVDACEGAVCPNGEECVSGRCQRIAPLVMADAGPTPAPDGGASLLPFDGGGLTDAGLIPGPDKPPSSTECLCSAPGARSQGAPLLTFGALALLWVIRRRR